MCGDEGGIEVDDDPPVEEFPGDQQPGEPARPVGDQAPYPPACLRAGFRDFAGHHRVETDQAPADRAV